MLTTLKDLRDLLVSLKLTVVLIVFSIILVMAATLDQDRKSTRLNSSHRL